MTEKKFYSLGQISKMTNITLSSLQNFYKKYKDQFPECVQDGRFIKFPEEAVQVFQKLKEEKGRARKLKVEKEIAPDKRGRKKVAKEISTPTPQIASTESALQQLLQLQIETNRLLKDLIAAISKPKGIKVTLE